MSNIAIIPARGGSKRIPKKNIKSFLGKPIIYYSIEEAKKTELFDEIMVSTDDEEIANYSIKCGAKVPFLRSIENSNDYASTAFVINEVLECYKNIQKKAFVNFCCIYATAPLLKSHDIVLGYNKLLNENLNSVLPVVKYSYPIWRGLKFENELTHMIWPENLNKRSQDLLDTYHDAGQWYWAKILEFDNSLFTEKTGAIILNENQVQDIDSMTDWEIAEIKYINLNRQNGL